MLSDWYADFMKTAPKAADPVRPDVQMPEAAPQIQPGMLTTTGINPRPASTGLPQPMAQSMTTTGQEPPATPAAPPPTPAASGMPAAATWTPGKDATVQGQLTGLLDKGGPLMDRAATRADQQMNARGLLNSSIAVGAGQSALYDAALPIAQQDAQTFGRAGEVNARTAADFAMQGMQQNFQAGENALQRSFQTGERVSQNDFTSVQSALDRQQQLRVQQLQEGGMDARQATQIAAQERAQKSDQVFTAEQKARDQLFSSSERVAIQAFETSRLQVQNDFTARMQALQEQGMDERQAKQLATQEALTRLGEAGVQNRFDAQQALQSSQFSFEQNAIDRRLIQQNEQKLKEMGYASELEKAQVPTAFAANVSSATMSAINAIAADGNLTPEAKQAAIQNVIDNGNATLRWASTTYNTAYPPIPGFAAPAAAPGATPAPPATAPAPPAPPVAPPPPPGDDGTGGGGA